MNGVHLVTLIASALALHAQPAPHASCTLGVYGRQISVACEVNRTFAGRPCLLRLGSSVVARGSISARGRYTARFRVARFLHRSQTVVFVVDGRVAGAIRA